MTRPHRNPRQVRYRIQRAAGALWGDIAKGITWPTFSVPVPLGSPTS